MLVLLIAASLVGLSIGGLVLSILNDNTIFTDTSSDLENSITAVSPTDNAKNDQNLLVNTPTPQPSALTFLDLKERIKNVSFIDGFTAKKPNPVVRNQRTQIMAYYVNWDENSLASLKQNINNIDVLIPEWLHIKDSQGGIELDDRANQVETLSFINKTKPDLKIIPLINNYNSKTEVWDDRYLTQVLSSPESQKALVDALYLYVKLNNFAGINIDFENFSSDYNGLMLDFLTLLQTKFKDGNLQTSVSLPFDDLTLNYTQISNKVDFVVLMAYDEKYSQDFAGSISSHAWFVESLNSRRLDIPAQKMVVGLGNYGYDWKNGGGPNNEAVSLTYGDVTQLARQKKSSIIFDQYFLNPHISYTDALNNPHEVWFLDAVTAYNQVKTSSSLSPYGYGLWRLGSEDQSIWKVFSDADNPSQETANKLQTIDQGYGIHYIGSGEILIVAQNPQAGKRLISYDTQTGLIFNQTMEDFASSYQVIKSGGGTLKEIVLTFDDGPDKKYTPKILDILRNNGVKATFFVVGAKAEGNQGILERIYSEGHEIGIHTYTHPNINNISPKQLEVEINATQKLIVSVTGVETKLFRPPYGEELEPQTPKEFEALKNVSDLGYYTVGMGVDPKDWRGGSAQDIIDSTLEQINEGAGNIVLLHDSGGNRSQTLIALPVIIKELQKRGYQFTTISDLLGTPVYVYPKSPSLNINANGFGVLSAFQGSVETIFKIGIILGIARLIVVISSALVEKQQKKKLTISSSYKPPVTILVPAYNEGVIIVKSVNALLKLDYPNYKIIAIDDGSTDNTYKIAMKNFGKNPKVRIIKSATNLGKSSALNLGVRASNTDIVIVQDCDTVLDKNALTYLVRHFEDQQVGAVAGNVKVGNRVNLLTKLQALEYTTSQNLDRRAYDLFNCINVVPGAISAWRKSALIEAGSFNSKTIAEDGELTIRVVGLGYKAVYEELAIGYTESPQNLHSFLKQRFRWVYGTMQYLKLHIKMFFNPKFGYLGFLSLPNVLVFQIIFPLLGPFMDFYFVSTILFNLWQKLEHPNYSLLSLKINLFSFGLFLLLDLFTQIIAFWMEEKKDYKLLFLLPFQRLFYRPLLYYVSIKSLLTAIKGPLVGWNKFLRTGMVELAKTS